MKIISILFLFLILCSACTRNPEEELVYQFNKMSAAEHIQEAKALIERYNGIDKYSLSEARRHLTAVTSNKVEFTSAQIIINQITQIETKEMNDSTRNLQQQAVYGNQLAVWYDIMHAIDKARDETESNWSFERQKQLENKYTAQVAKNHKITMAQLKAISKQGNKENWPMPGEVADRERAARPNPGREKRNAEFGAELYKAGQ